MRNSTDTKGLRLSQGLIRNVLRETLVSKQLAKSPMSLTCHNIPIVDSISNGHANNQKKSEV
jgi:hypothetical protein